MPALEATNFSPCPHYPWVDNRNLASQPERRRQHLPCAPASTQHFDPKQRFRVVETDDAYEYRCVLKAGINKEHLNIEVIDPLTLYIQFRGREIERPEEEQPTSEPEEGVVEPASDGPKRNSNKYQATVEDDIEDSWTEVSSTQSWTPVSSPKLSQAKPASTKEPEKSAAIQKSVSDNKKEAGQSKKKASKVWVRGPEEATHYISFTAEIDQDRVTASLENRHLTIILPKKTHKRIPVL